MTSPDSLRQEAEELAFKILNAFEQNSGRQPRFKHDVIMILRDDYILPVLARTRQQAQAEERERNAKIAERWPRVSGVVCECHHTEDYKSHSMGVEIAASIRQSPPPETP